MRDTQETGPIYGQPIPSESLPIGGGMTQAMASRRDLEGLLNCNGGHRVVGAYEMLAQRVNELESENALLKEARVKKLWGDHIKTATHPENPAKLLELDVPQEINTAALDVGRWMEVNEVRELWGLALRSVLSSKTCHLEQACDRIRDMLEGDDGQAWKEAKTFLKRIGQPVSLAEAKEVQS